jgi:hypothetical protein
MCGQVDVRPAFTRVEIVQHISEDHMERYAMRTLPDAETGPLEEHLLI